MRSSVFTLLLVTVAVDSLYRIVQNLNLLNGASQTSFREARMKVEVPDEEVDATATATAATAAATTTTTTYGTTDEIEGADESRSNENDEEDENEEERGDTSNDNSNSNSNNDNDTENQTEGSETNQPPLLSQGGESSSIKAVEIQSSQEGETNDNNDSGNDSEKVCLIHAGPHKTASSTLQMSIFQNNAIRQALKNDNYRVPIFRHGEFKVKDITRPETYSPKNHAMLTHCLLGDSIWNIFCPPDIETKIMDAFGTFVNKSGNTGANILLSSEAFDRPTLDIPRLMSYMEPHNYKVHFVLYYRRFYDWIFSTYYQQMGKMALKGNGLDVQTFLEWLEVKLEESQLHYSVSVYNRLKLFPNINVTIVNMHQSQSIGQDGGDFDVVETFFCNHADSAPQACNAARAERKDNDSITNINMSKTLDWHLFRVKLPLYHPIELSNGDALKLVEEKFSNMTDIPRLCLTPDLKERILQLSIDMEIASTPEWWYNSDEGLKSLKADFEEKVKSKLCFVDTEAVVRSTEWQEFLTTTSDSIHSS